MPDAERTLTMTRGSKPGVDPTAKARVASIDVRRRQADARAAGEVAPIIAGLWAAGVTSHHVIAKELNNRRIRTPTGKGKWYSVQVRHALARLK
jgi:hypothetical protein